MVLWPFPATVIEVVRLVHAKAECRRQQGTHLYENIYEGQDDHDTYICKGNTQQHFLHWSIHLQQACAAPSAAGTRQLNVIMAQQTLPSFFCPHICHNTT